MFSKMLLRRIAKVLFIKSATTSELRRVFLNSSFNTLLWRLNETESSPGEGTGVVGMCVIPGGFFFGDLRMVAILALFMGVLLNSLKRFFNEVSIAPY